MIVTRLGVCLLLLLLSSATQAAEPTQQTGKSEPAVRTEAVRADEKGQTDEKGQAEKKAKAGKKGKAEKKAKAEEEGEKLISGMSIVGNDEAPKSLVIVPWKTSQLGQTLDVSNSLGDSRQPVDRDVFMRELDYYQIRTASQKAPAPGQQ
jgi:hypothetical protein